MRINLKEYIKQFIILIVGGVIGWWIGIYMDRPDISYYTQINQQAEINSDNSHRVLRSWYRSRKNLRRSSIYSSSVYISNTGHHAYEGKDFSHSKEPLRIESNSPIELFTIDDKKSPETAASIKEKNGIYYIEFDFLNYGQSIHFVFTHSQPIRYLHVKGSGVNLPYIKEKTPLRIWAYRHFFLGMLIFVVVGILLSIGILWIFNYKTPKFYKEFDRLLQQFLIEKNKRIKKDIMKQIDILFKKYIEKDGEVN